MIGSGKVTISSFLFFENQPVSGQVSARLLPRHDLDFLLSNIHAILAHKALID
jgi:hypothetical protein